MNRPVRSCPAVVLLLLAVVLTACGDSTRQPPPAAGAAAPGAPTLLKRELRPGEVMVDGESSPQTHRQLRFDGRYLVRFAQYAPEAPGRRFEDQVPFVAELRPTGNFRARPITLFEAAAERGRRTLELHGSYDLEVAFGDFPYVIRFTPLG